MLGAGKVADAATIDVPAGSNLQEAINAARPGDTIVLAAGATYAGPITLPNKGGGTGTDADYITIRTSDQTLPEGVRVTPADAPRMAAIVSPGSAQNALKTAPGAHHYRFVGVEFRTNAATDFAYVLVVLGHDRQTLAEVPHHLTFDRCIVRAFPDQELKRGVELNSAHTEIVNSHIAGFKVRGQEAQAILGWNGPGPFRIVNNYLEGAGENVMFGGADPSIPDLVPSDIEFRRNHLFKPLSWQPGQAHYTVKNLFELKNARRVVVDGNLMENCWGDAQDGTAVMLTPRNQYGTAPWSTVEDVSFTNNTVRHAGAGVSILGADYLHPSKRLARVLIKNNLWLDIDRRWGGNGAFYSAQGGDDIEVSHNTALQSGNVILAGGQHAGFVFRDNIVRSNDYGVIGTGRGIGLDTLNYFFPGHVYSRNVMIAPTNYPNAYPAGNLYAAGMAGVGFADPAGGDYRLLASSPYKSAGTDGRDVGCDVEALTAAHGGATLTPPPPGAPAVSITTPTNAATLSAGSYVSISATASSGDSAISRVDFYADEQFIGATAVAPYSVLWAGAGVGSHVLTAKATDSRGVSAVSSPVVVNVAVPANSPPAVGITAPTANKEFNEGDNVSAVEAGGHDLPLKEKGAKKPERRRTRGNYSTASPAAKRHNQKSSGAKKPK